MTRCVNHGSKLPRAALALLLASLLGACPGDFGGGGGKDAAKPVPDTTQRLDTGPLSDFTSDSPPTFDGPAADGPGGGADQGPACSPAGTAANCTPKDGSGCGANASCYLITATGPACVCPAGGKAEGAACNTTSECGPGLACAGDVAPGKCARFCDPPPAADTCGAGKKCTPFTPFPAFGACL
ncbi:MAG: hypothetical protein KC503_14535 [Myxococcales bacterium]|nr:hypothetical protein [Myxococcales bacterium]